MLRVRPDRIGALAGQVQSPRQRWPQTRAITSTAIVRPGAGRSLLGPDRPIATLGSCFASEVRKWLVEKKYPISGTGPDGRYSPRPLFNTASIRQEVERAFSVFAPSERVWHTTAEGRPVWLDPYRHNSTFVSESTITMELTAVEEELRNMFLAARLIILTIGQAEIWHSKDDGAVFSAIPPKDVLDPARHGWRLMDYEENVANLNRTLELLAENAPAAHIVLTLSPVPLMATFRRMNAVVANGEGKAILRAAIGKAVGTWEGRVSYFPSYEIAQALPRKAFRPDGRHVSAWGVAQIMAAFERWAR